MFLPSCINKHTFRYALLHVHRCISLCAACFSLLGSVSVCIIEVDCVSQPPGLSLARRQTSLSLSERSTRRSLQAAIGADGSLFPRSLLPAILTRLCLESVRSWHMPQIVCSRWAVSHSTHVTGDSVWPSADRDGNKQKQCHTHILCFLITILAKQW